MVSFVIVLLRVSCYWDWLKLLSFFGGVVVVVFMGLCVRCRVRDSLGYLLFLGLVDAVFEVDDL